MVTLLQLEGVESGTEVGLDEVTNPVWSDELKWFIEVRAAEELIEGTARH